MTLAEDPPYSFATDVELEPDGSGEICVGAYSAAGWPLGTDCLRVYDEKNDHTSGVVGSEGGEIKLGKFGVEFGAADTAVDLPDGTRVLLPPSLHEAVEVELQRQPRYGNDVFSLLDIYDVNIPAGVSLDRSASVWWEFDKQEQNLPADPRDLLLGATDVEGDFLPYDTQLLLPDIKVAVVSGFSENKAAAGQKNCNEKFPEKVVCCAGQQLRQASGNAVPFAVCAGLALTSLPILPCAAARTMSASAARGAASPAERQDAIADWTLPVPSARRPSWQKRPTKNASNANLRTARTGKTPWPAPGQNHLYLAATMANGQSIVGPSLNLMEDGVAVMLAY